MLAIAIACVAAFVVLLSESLPDCGDGVSYTFRMNHDGYPRMVFVSPRGDGGLRSYACYFGCASVRVHAESDRQACKLLKKKLRSSRQNKSR